MSDLVEFLRARLDEDEQIARAAVDPDRPGLTWRWEDADTDEPVDLIDQAFTEEYVLEGDEVSLRTVELFPTRSVGPLPGFIINHTYEVRPGVALHIARWDPARVLAEVEAKRRAIERCRSIAEMDGWEYADAPDLAEHVMLALAQPYADHDDFAPAWRLA